MTLVVKSNNHRRVLVSADQVPAKHRDDFGYITGEDRFTLRLVEYQGAWYDTSDTEGLAPADLRALGWDTYMSDSFFSGIVFRHHDLDGEYMYDEVIVGRFYQEG